MKTDGNRLLKRVSRVAGFALSPLAAFIPQIILFSAVAVAFCGLIKHNSGRFRFAFPGFQGGYSLVMLFHQLHYFTGCFGNCRMYHSFRSPFLCYGGGYGRRL